MDRNYDRIQRIKRKYGANCFHRWGMKGGSPILRAYAQGRLVKRK